MVPVGFGTDALGGVINIVTNQRKLGWFADASYSYGSFNTHKSFVNFGQSFKNGLLYEINAFQNLSDNNYYIDYYVTEFSDDGISENTDKTKIYHIKRFNDRFHNEAVSGKIGVADKKWADRLMLGFTYTHFYKEIQNGVLQKVVFGRKTPSWLLVHSLFGIPQTQLVGRGTRCHGQCQLQPQHHPQHRYGILQIQLVGTTEIYRRARGAIQPEQRGQEQELERYAHGQLSHRPRPSGHAQPCAEHF